MIKNINPRSSESYFNLSKKELAIRPDSSCDEVLHELGHVKISNGKSGKIYKKLDSISSSVRGKKEDIGNISLGSIRLPRSYVANGYKFGDIGRNVKPGKEAVRDLAREVKTGGANYLVEKKASREGLKIGKKLGFTSKELKAGKEKQRAANNTYKYDYRNKVKLKSANVINIPSRRAKI